MTVSRQWGIDITRNKRAKLLIAEYLFTTCSKVTIFKILITCFSLNFCFLKRNGKLLTIKLKSKETEYFPERQFYWIHGIFYLPRLCKVGVSANPSENNGPTAHNIAWGPSV